MTDTRYERTQDGGREEMSKIDEVKKILEHINDEHHSQVGLDDHITEIAQLFSDPPAESGLLTEEQAIKAYENNNPTDDHAIGVIEVTKAPLTRRETAREIKQDIESTEFGKHQYLKDRDFWKKLWAKYGLGESK